MGLETAAVSVMAFAGLGQLAVSSSSIELSKQIADIEASILEADAELIETQALQQEAIRLRDFRELAAANDLEAANSGFAYSQSFSAIQDRNRRDAEEDISSIRARGKIAQARTIEQARLTRKGAKLNAGLMRTQSFLDLAKLGGQTAMLSGGGGGGGGGAGGGAAGG